MGNQEAQFAVDSGGDGLCTLDQFKTRYGIVGTADDEAIQSVIDGASADMTREMGRTWNGAPCLAKAERTVVLSVRDFDQSSLWLPAWPISDVDSVVEALDGDFEGEAELEEDDDFRVDSSMGRLIRVACPWLVGDACIQVVYTGGYTLPGTFLADGYLQGEGEVLLPADITDACLQQAGYVWTRRSSIGAGGGSAGQGGSFSDSGADQLLPGVKAVCASYRRMMI